MDQFRDLRRLTLIASICIGAYLFTTIVGAILDATSSAEERLNGTAGLFAILQLLVTLICITVVGRWIYLASRNAHGLRHNLSISPGWAVGWYFVPFANLIQPLEAMRETWSASVGEDDSLNSGTPAILVWWWGLWLATNILSNIAFQMDRHGVSPEGSAAIGLIGAALTVPLCFLLISIMRQVTAGQDNRRIVEALA